MTETGWRRGRDGERQTGRSGPPKDGASPSSAPARAVRSARFAQPTLARIPPLKALRAFVSAARHLSFIEAGKELHVSAAAIGQQIRALEDYLGEALFSRERGQLVLTATGRALMPGLTDAFDTVLETLAGLAAPRAETVVRLSVAPSFAARWLIPRLEQFRAEAPDIDVDIAATTVLADVARDGVDAAVRFGLGGYVGLYVETLFREAVVPVCSPDFAATHALGPATASLAGVPLLHENGPEHDRDLAGWPVWLRARGLPVRYDPRGMRLNLSAMVLDAAIAGQGLGLAKLRLAEADLTAGRLVAPLGSPLGLDIGYHLVTTPAKARQPAVSRFIGWLTSECAAVRSAGGAD